MKLIGKLKIKPSNEIKNTRIGIGFECYDRDLFTPEKCYDLAAMTGAKAVRMQTGWARTEKEKGVYDFSWLDSMVDNLLKRGMEPWFNVGYGNPLYMPDAPNSTAVGCVPTLYGEECLNAWIDYVKAMTEHFKDRITHYEIWNESDLNHFWFPEKPSAKGLAELIKITGNAIREVYPEAKLGTCLSGSKPDYIYTLFSNLEPKDLDFYCTHNYDRFPDNSWRSRRDTIAHQIMNDLGFGHLEIWMGECGHASWHPKGHGQCKEGGGSEHRQAVWHLRRAFLDLQNKMKLTSFFMIVDLWEKPYEKAVEVLTRPAAQGILNGITYTPKASHKAVSNVANVLSDENEVIEPFALLEGRSCNPDTPSTTVFFKHNGKPCMAYWLACPVEVEEAHETCYIVPNPMKKLKDPVVIDMLTGDVFERDTDEFKYPLREYPLVYCERDTFEIENN